MYLFCLALLEATATCTAVVLPAVAALATAAAALPDCGVGDIPLLLPVSLALPLTRAAATNKRCWLVLAYCGVGDR